MMIKTLEELGFKEYIVEEGFRYYQNDTNDDTIFMSKGRKEIGLSEYFGITHEIFNAVELKMKELGWWK